MPFPFCCFQKNKSKYISTSSFENPSANLDKRASSSPSLPSPSDPFKLRDTGEAEGRDPSFSPWGHTDHEHDGPFDLTEQEKLHRLLIVQLAEGVSSGRGVSPPPLPNTHSLSQTFISLHKKTSNPRLSSSQLHKSTEVRKRMDHRSLTLPSKRKNSVQEFISTLTRNEEDLRRGSSFQSSGVFAPLHSPSEKKTEVEGGPQGEQQAIMNVKRHTASFSSDGLMDKILSSMGSSPAVPSWRTPENSVLFLDWDDTLFPTSWLRSLYPELVWNEACPEDSEYRGSLEEAEDLAIRILEEASSLSQVFLLTLASPPWVTISIRNFMPRLEGTLEKLQIPVVYALEQVKGRQLRSVQNSGGCVYTFMKQKAMEKKLKRVFKNSGQWHNVMSIGDSQFERFAMQESVFHREQSEPCRGKTIKLVDTPDIVILTAQLQLLTSWLPTMVSFDGDFDLDLEHEPDESLRRLTVVMNGENMGGRTDFDQNALDEINKQLLEIV